MENVKKILCLLIVFFTTATFSQSTKNKKMSNKDLVKTAMTELFVNRDVTALDRYWSDNYIQHNPTIPNGKDHLKPMIQGLPTNFKYEAGLIIAEGNYVTIHGRYTGFGPVPMVAVDIFKIKDGKLVEHWDVLQQEVPTEKTASKNPMFAPK